MSQKVTAIILAAGKGTRMKSSRFKVLHQIAHRPLILHLMDTVNRLANSTLVAVTSPDQDPVRAILPEGCKTVIQEQALGTGHAVLAAKEHLCGDDPGVVLVLFGADPLIQQSTLEQMIAKCAAGAAVTILGFRAPNPQGLGRLIQDETGAVLRIVEEKEATAAEKAITLCNAGAMAIDGKSALDWLKQITNDNAKGEYYLTDIAGIARQHGGRVDFVEAQADEVIGVDDRADLAEAEAVFQARKRSALLSAGVTMHAPETVFFAHDTEIGADTIVEPHVVFGPGVTIADNVTVRAFSHVEGATLATGTTVGPYARLRPGTVLQEGARVGNFVEVKNTNVGLGAKLPHLSYVGDADIGAGANIGAGTITCNYNGFSKSKTTIGDGAFIGSNATLVAPVEIGAGGFVGAGSTITKNVAANALGLGRSQQTPDNDGWATRFRETQAVLKNKKD